MGTSGLPGRAGWLRRAGLVVLVAVVGFVLGGQSHGPPGPVGQPTAGAGLVSASPDLVSAGSGSVGAGGGVAGAGGGVTGAGQGGRPPAIGAATVQEDPELLDPGLGRAHRRALYDRPVFQHLPYRDREIGVNFDRVVAGGRLELLVTYLGSRARAVGDLRRLLARYGDPGVAYVERYERVF